MALASSRFRARLLRPGGRSASPLRDRARGGARRRLLHRHRRVCERERPVRAVGICVRGRPAGADRVLATPIVESGHVAGWIGVGGPGQGPGGSSEWIQVGLNSLPGSGNRLYYEVMQPGSAMPTYGELDTNVVAGRLLMVAVLETAGSSGVWRIWVDARAVAGRSRCRGAAAPWRRWRWERAGTAAAPPATATVTASSTSRLPARRAALGIRCGRRRRSSTPGTG
jgi:hypothetical protein